jgi:hypothetical protein
MGREGRARWGRVGSDGAYVSFVDVCLSADGDVEHVGNEHRTPCPEEVDEACHVSRDQGW